MESWFQQLPERRDPASTRHGDVPVSLQPDGGLAWFIAVENQHTSSRQRKKRVGSSDALRPEEDFPGYLTLGFVIISFMKSISQTVRLLDVHLPCYSSGSASNLKRAAPTLAHPYVAAFETVTLVCITQATGNNGGVRRQGHWFIPPFMGTLTPRTSKGLQHSRGRFVKDISPT